MKKIYNQIKDKLFKLLFKIDPHKNEILPSFLLQKLFHSGSYLPFTTSTLKMRSLVCVLNDIAINRRRNIIEFGSGISSVLIARLIKLNKLDGYLYSIEHDLGWLNHIKWLLEVEGLTQYVKLIYAPLVEGEGKNYYDKSFIAPEISGIYFDSIIIDGPPSSNEKSKKSRLYNMEVFVNSLSDDCVIFIDNTNRKEEERLVKSLRKVGDFSDVKLDGSFSILTRGSHFNFVI